MATNCQIRGCHRPASCKGLCRPHYDKQRPKKVFVCTFAGCGREGYAKRLCRGHWRQLIQDRPLTALRARIARQPEFCSFEGCGRPRYARGLCRPHDAQMRRVGVLHKIGDTAWVSEQRRAAWAALPEDEKQRRIAQIQSVQPYERTEEWSRRLSTASRARWAAKKGRPLTEKRCVGCNESFMPNSGVQIWCSDDCQKRHRRALTHGITLKQLIDMEARQGHACAICNRKTTLHIDHDHDTGRVRGLLCSTCNTGLGKFGDDPVRLGKAIKYLTA